MAGKKRLTGKLKGFLSGQGISKSLFEVSEKSGNFILRLQQNVLLEVFVWAVLFEKISEPAYFC